MEDNNFGITDEDKDRYLRYELAAKNRVILIHRIIIAILIVAIGVIIWRQGDKLAFAEANAKTAYSQGYEDAKEKYDIAVQETQESNTKESVATEPKEDLSADGADTIILNSVDELKDFVRDDKNIGKTVSFQCHYSCEHPVYDNTLLFTSDTLFIAGRIKGSNENLIMGDFVTVTGEFEGLKDNHAFFNVDKIELAKE